MLADFLKQEQIDWIEKVRRTYLAPGILIPIAIVAAILWFITSFFWQPNQFGGANPMIVQKDPVELSGSYQSFRAQSTGWGSPLSFTVTPTSSYDITARVLAKKRLFVNILGAESLIRPIHLYLGWREMSDLKVLKHAHFSYNGGISSAGFGIDWHGLDSLPQDTLDDIYDAKHRAHYAIIPSNQTILSQLTDLTTGEIIRLEGYMSNIHVQMAETCENDYGGNFYVTKVTKY